MNTFFSIDRRSVLGFLGVFSFVIFYYIFSVQAVFAEDVAVQWSQQFGSVTGLLDRDYATAVDSDGAAYVVGAIDGALPGFTSFGFLDAFVCKYAADGTLLWMHQFGTSRPDEATAVVIGDSNIYITGLTEGVFDNATSFGGVDAFVAKLTTDGVPVWTKHYGTESSDWANAITYNAETQSLYIAGTTGGIFAGNTPAGNGDGFVMKIDVDGTTAWARQFGSIGSDESSGIAANEYGVFSVGRTWEQIGPDPALGNMDGYLVALSHEGTKLWIRQFGTSDFEEVFDVAIASTSIYITGFTQGVFGTESAGLADGYLLKYSISGTPVWEKQFGTDNYDYARDVSVINPDDPASDVLVVGYTYGVFADETRTGITDVFVSHFTDDGTQSWVKQYGTTESTFGYSISAADGHAYVVGLTTGSFLGYTNLGGYDAFVSRVAFGEDYDNDGFLNALDPSLFDYSTNFDDGTTYGSVYDGGDQQLRVEDAADPDQGVLVTAAPNGGTAPSLIDVCDNDARYTLYAGDSLTITCGSVITTVHTGTIAVAFYADDASVLTTQLSPGTTITFKPDTKIIIADIQNPVAITVELDGESYTVAPGNTEGFNGDVEGPVVTETTASPNPIPLNVTILISARADDGATGDTDMAKAYYSVDGVGTSTMSTNDGAFDTSTEYVEAMMPSFSEAGVHEVCVWGEDARGNTGNAECILIAVYDPEGGYVSGGGRIYSPAGAYAPDTALEGNAVFGFTSRYQNGAQIPTGHTVFRFIVAHLGFTSSDYQWLVVAGARAQFKGTGTINGEGNYGFMITGIDEEMPGGGDEDKFRIKIWDIDSNDVIVYDNNMEVSDTSDPSTAISGGNIIIHTD